MRAKRTTEELMEWETGSQQVLPSSNDCFLRELWVQKTP